MIVFLPGSLNVLRPRTGLTTPAATGNQCVISTVGQYVLRCLFPSLTASGTWFSPSPPEGMPRAGAEGLVRPVPHCPT